MAGDDKTTPKTAAKKPTQKAPARKAAKKAPATKRAAPKKAAPKKAAPKKAAPKKVAPKKAAPNKAAATRAAGTKTAATKTAATKTAATKTAATKTAATKRASAKKSPARKPAARKAAVSKVGADTTAAAKSTAPKTAAPKNGNGAPATIQIKRERVAIVGGLRSPFTKAWTTLNDVDPVELSTQVARETLFGLDLDIHQVDEVVWGTVIAVPRAPNIAREVALNLGMYRVPGFSVTRACATGFQAAASAAEMIELGRAEIVLAGGVDVTSHAPVTYKKRVIDQLQKAQRQSGVQLVQTIAQVNPLDLLPSPPALTERYTGLTMGQHAELMAQNFDISRADQDELAVASHSNAHEAREKGWIAEGLMTVMAPKGPVADDNLIRSKMDPEKIARLRPAFDRKNGTITAATSSALTDGASCVVLMSESKAKELGVKPLGFMRSYAFAALDPRENMLLGNAYSVPTALDRAGAKLGDMDVVEIHEAFAAQVLSNIKCMASDSFNQDKLGRDTAVGDVDRSKLNVWGGSIAYGHPFAATGGRMIRQLLDILAQRDGEIGIATACAAGGMGAAMVLERN